MSLLSKIPPIRPCLNIFSFYSINVLCLSMTPEPLLNKGMSDEHPYLVFPKKQPFHLRPSFFLSVCVGASVTSRALMSNGKFGEISDDLDSHGKPSCPPQGHSLPGLHALGLKNSRDAPENTEKRTREGSRHAWRPTKQNLKWTLDTKWLTESFHSP